MKTILFYWSKGADTRVRIIRKIGECTRKKSPCYLNTIADYLKLSHVAVKKHLDLLIEEEYIKCLNPDGKPVYMDLTEKGWDVFEEFSGRK